MPVTETQIEEEVERHNAIVNEQNELRERFATLEQDRLKSLGKIEALTEIRNANGAAPTRSQKEE